LFSRHDVNLRCAAKVSQSSFAQSTAHDRFDQTPRRRYFAADVNPRRIDSIHDRSQTKSEITRGGIDRRQRFRVARTGASNQILYGETRLFGFARTFVREIAPKVTRQRGEVRNICFPATSCAARTAWSIDAQRHMTKLARGVMAPAHHFAIYDDTHANTVGNTHEDGVTRSDHVAARGPQLGQCACFTGVLDVHGDAESNSEWIAEVNVAPT